MDRGGRVRTRRAGGHALHVGVRAVAAPDARQLARGAVPTAGHAARRRRGRRVPRRTGSARRRPARPPLTSPVNFIGYRPWVRRFPIEEVSAVLLFSEIFIRFERTK